MTKIKEELAIPSVLTVWGQIKGLMCYLLLAKGHMKAEIQRGI